MVGIPTATQQWLTPLHHSLPTILYTHCQNPMPSYSKAPRGLSVLLQVAGIFTGITTSPGLQPRQLSNHFTIRAGRNLPDKEFRYLRTVIVTAAALNSEENLVYLLVSLLDCHLTIRSLLHFLKTFDRGSFVE